MDIGKRIRELLKRKKLSQRELAKALDVQDSFVSNMIHGKAKISLENLSSICSFLNVSFAEFFAPTAASEQDPQYMIDFFSYCRSLSRSDIDALVPIVKRMAKLRQQNAATGKKSAISRISASHSGDFYPVHVLGEAAAGRPLFAEASPDEVVEVPSKYADPEHYRIIRARGDSMEPKIHTGDIVIAEIGVKPFNGQMALVYLAGLADDEYTIKRIYYDKGRIILRSYNGIYPDMIRMPEEIRSCEIVAEVIKTGGAK